HPFFLVTLIATMAQGASPDSAAQLILVSLYGGAAFGGYLVSGLLGVVGLARRRLLGAAWVLLLMPLHWLLLSCAAWRALYQLVFKPYAWEKTEHGLAKSSRLADDMTKALVELERYLTHLKDTGQLPSLPVAATAMTPAMER